MLHRLYEAYRKEGIDAVGRKVKYGYRQWISNAVRPWMPTRKRLLLLNGVEIPMDVSLIDRWLPFYKPPVPVTHNPNYEGDEAEAVRSYCKPGDRVVVIGGGLGVTTVVAAQSIGPTGRVHVYEPTDAACTILQAAVWWNQCADRVTVTNAAVGTQRTSCFTHGTVASAPSVECAALPDADVLEMDCEGEEEAILSEMKMKPRVVLVETHDNHDRIVQILRNRGYRIDRVKEGPPAEKMTRTHVAAVQMS